MFAVAFRRFRLESLAASLGLGAVGLLALITGTMMRDQFRSSGLAECLARNSGAECQSLIDYFDNRFASLQLLIVPLILVPALFGAFVGAPLVAREFESGTHRFLWTQGITRGRWFASMTGAAIVLSVVAGVVFTTITGLWLHTTNTVTDERFGRLYDFQGVVPVAAAVFAVCVGIASGVLLRRTLPAMAATIAVFIATRLVIGSELRPRFAAAETLDVAFGTPNPLTGTGAWVMSERTLTAGGLQLGTGGSLDISRLGDVCPALALGAGRFPDQTVVDQCLADVGVHQLIRYQPAGRFWAFQLAESGILVGLAAVAILVAVWGLNHRDA